RPLPGARWGSWGILCCRWLVSECVCVLGGEGGFHRMFPEARPISGQALPQMTSLSLPLCVRVCVCVCVCEAHRGVFAQLTERGEGLLVGLAYLLNDGLQLGRQLVRLHKLRLGRLLLLLVPV